jgi:hypothetical protein
MCTPFNTLLCDLLRLPLVSLLFQPSWVACFSPTTHTPYLLIPTEIKMASVSTASNPRSVSCRVDVADDSPSSSLVSVHIPRKRPMPVRRLGIAASSIRPLLGTWYSLYCMRCRLPLSESSIAPAWNCPLTPSPIPLSRSGICLTPACPSPPAHLPLRLHSLASPLAPAPLSPPRPTANLLHLLQAQLGLCDLDLPRRLWLLGRL